jgi:hypothetical protein
MTKAQFQREQLRLAREKELRLVAEARAAADPRYVGNAIAFLWEQCLKRKQEMRDTLHGIERQRVDTLTALYS